MNQLRLCAFLACIVLVSCLEGIKTSHRIEQLPPKAPSISKERIQQRYSSTGGSEQFEAEPQALLRQEQEAELIGIKQGNADGYLDAILESVTASLVANGMDNYTLPDVFQSFSEEFLGITWQGELDLTQGFLFGLENLRRFGDADLVVSGENGSISLAGTLEFLDLGAGYHMHVVFMGIGIDAEAALSITSVQVGLKARLIVVDPALKSLAVVIDELNIANPGQVSVDFSGLGSLDFLLEGLGSIVGNVFGGLILDAVEGPISQAIIEALGETIDPNDYLDDILASVAQLMLANGWDTFPLPDEVQGFSVDFLGVNWHAEATMTEGFLSGLETIHRTEDIIVGIDKDTDAITIDASLGFNDFTAGYTLYIGVMDLGIEAGAKVIISKVLVHLQASIYITDNTSITNSTELFKSMRDTQIIIDKLDISNEFFIAVDFDGLGLFNFLLDAMGLVVVNVFSGLIFSIIEGPVAEALEAALEDALPEKLLAQMYPQALVRQFEG